MIRDAAWIIIGAIVLGILSPAATASPPRAAQPEIRTVADVLESLKGELIRLRVQFPELATAKDIKINYRRMELDYRHNCRYWGKRGHEETGPNACAITMQVLSKDRFLHLAATTETELPTHTWANLRSVGWIHLYVGKAPSPDFKVKANEVLQKHVAMLNALDRQAAAGQGGQKATSGPTPPAR